MPTLRVHISSPRNIAFNVVEDVAIHIEEIDDDLVLNDIANEVLYNNIELSWEVIG